MPTLRSYTKAFWLAVQFMSRLPTPQFGKISTQEMGLAISFFPIVGLIIGICLAGLGVLGSKFLFLPEEILAALLLAFWAWITGGLHLDGLADTADGWLGSVGNHARALEIMKDSRIGTGGGVALVIHLLIKWLAIKYLLIAQAWLWLALTPSLARIAAIALMPLTRYVSLQGLAEQMILHLKKIHILIWTLVALSLLTWHSPWLTFVTVLFWLWVRWLMQRITGGMTGDTAGMMTEIMEVMIMLGALIPYQ